MLLRSNCRSCLSVSGLLPPSETALAFPLHRPCFSSTGDGVSSKSSSIAASCPVPCSSAISSLIFSFSSSSRAVHVSSVSTVSSW